MASLQPTHAGLLRADFVDDVASPSFDSLSLSERQQLRLAKPLSYLNVTRSPDDEPVGTWASTADLLQACRTTLDTILELDAFDLSRPSGFYGYELLTEGHRQLGLVCDVAVDDLVNRAIRPHEETKIERARLLAEHLTVVEAQSSPIAVGFRSTPGAAAALHAACDGPADLTIDTGDDLVQRVWRISTEDAEPIVAAIGEAPLYLIDGHHRAVASIERQRTTSDPAADSILAAVFPADELRLLEYNRWVQEIGPRTMAEVLADLSVRVGLEPVAEADQARPTRAGQLGVYVSGQWYRGSLAPQLDPTATRIIDRTDPVVLQRKVLAPTFDILDAESDQRLQYLPGGQPAQEIADHIDANGGIAFLLAPLELDVVCQAADAGEVLPPKSTYFEPKVRSGVFLRTVGSRR